MTQPPDHSKLPHALYRVVDVVPAQKPKPKSALAKAQAKGKNKIAKERR